MSLSNDDDLRDVELMPLLKQATAHLARARVSGVLRDVITQLMDFTTFLFAQSQHQVYLRQCVEEENSALRQRLADSLAHERKALRDVLLCATDGRLILCAAADDLPARRRATCDPIALTPQSGIRELRRAASAACAEREFDDGRWHDLEIAVGEAAMNTVVHAGSGTGVVCADDAGPIQVWIVDSGRGIAPENLPLATLSKGYSTAGSLGQGMKMMIQTADRIYLLTGPTGTTVVLEQCPLAESMANCG